MLCDDTTEAEDDGLGECDERVIVDEDDELGAGSASLSRWRIARNFLCGLYASSIKLLVSYNGGACRTRFNTGMFSTMCLFSSD